MERVTAVVPRQQVPYTSRPALIPPPPGKPDDRPKWQRPGPLRTTLRYLVLWALAAFFLMPVYVLIVTAFKNPADVSVTRIWELPTSLSFANFGAVLPKLGAGFRNSLALAIPASLISALLGCANGFVLSKFRFPFSNLVFPLILFGIFVPYQAVIIPVSQTMTAVGLRGGDDPSGGLLGLMLIHIIYGLPTTPLIFPNHFLSMPRAPPASARPAAAGGRPR